MQWKERKALLSSGKFKSSQEVFIFPFLSQIELPFIFLYKWCISRFRLKGSTSNLQVTYSNTIVGNRSWRRPKCVEKGATLFPRLFYFTLDLYLIMLTIKKEASSTIFWVFGMTWPGIEPPLSRTISAHSTQVIPIFLELFHLGMYTATVQRWQTRTFCG